MRILIASCIRQPASILEKFLESLDCLVKPGSFSYYFIENGLDEEAHLMLSEWIKGMPAEVDEHQNIIPYIRNDETHFWTPELVTQVIKMKDQIIEKAKGYDYLLFIDSDHYLHPDTLTQLLSRQKDIITEIVWTRWRPNEPEMPNAWFWHNYGFPADGLKRLRTEPLINVAGIGGLYLISNKALEAGVSFKRVEGVDPHWGEDRHFAVRAKQLGFDIWCDTVFPSFHIYRLGDLPRLQEWKRRGRLGRGFKVLDCRWGTQSELEKPEFMEIIDEIDNFKTVFPRWSRCWEYPYAYLGSALEDAHLILDAGCGDSPFKFFLESHGGEVHCIDKAQIEIPENSSVVFKRCDIAEIDYPDDYFDRAFCISVLEHTQQPAMKYIMEMLRVLKIGGTLHLTIDFNRWATQWKFKKPEILKLCQELMVDYPLEPIDLLKSEDHLEGKTVGEGLSVLGFTILKTGKVEHVEEGHHKGVRIAIPHTGSLRCELVTYLIREVARHIKDQSTTLSVDLSYGMPVDSNRNIIVKRFLESDSEWLLMIDSDIQPPDDTLNELLSHGEKLVSALCWSTMPGEEKELEELGIPYPVAMEKDPKGGWRVNREAVTSGKRLIAVDAGNTACLLAHRDVFLSLDEPPFMLGYDENGIVDAGEDFTFFDKVLAKGYQPYVDTFIRCGHYKTQDIRRVNQLLAETARRR